ncbi:MAG: hypothetical protein MRZ09_00100 [Coprobacillus sp.]|nr:hypothetical protein [Coprobacillus sp.]MDY4145588.1 hypothetical protein [Bacilli bacterium]
MKRKIKKYLNSKDENEYSNLDRIFELYLSGDIKKLLSKYVGVGVYPTINKLGKTIQLNYNYHNIYVIIDFFEDKYNVVVYHAGINAEDLEKLFIDYEYPNDFDLEKLIKKIDEKIKNHPKLKDTTLIEKKKKIYTLIAWINWSFPILVCGCIAIYGFTNDKTIKVDQIWAILFIALPLIIGCIFDVKSKRLK